MFRVPKGMSNYITLDGKDSKYDWDDESRRELFEHYLFMWMFNVYRNQYKKLRFTERLEWIKALARITHVDAGLLQIIMQNYDSIRTGKNALDSMKYAHGFEQNDIVCPHFPTTIRVLWNAGITQRKLMALLSLTKPRLLQIVSKLDSEYDTSRDMNWLPAEWFDLLTDVYTYFASMLGVWNMYLPIPKREIERMKRDEANMEDRTDETV